MTYLGLIYSGEEREMMRMFLVRVVVDDGDWRWSLSVKPVLLGGLAVEFIGETDGG